MNEPTPTCTNCGTPLGERARNFCEHCGAALARSSAAPTPPNAPPPVPNAPPPLPGPPPVPRGATPERVPPLPRAASAESAESAPNTPPPPLDRAQRVGYVPDAVPPPAPRIDAPESSQFSDSPGAALKAFLVSGAVLLIPCCGIGVVLIVLFAWWFSARAMPR